MNSIITQTDSVLLIGDGNLTASVAVCLLRAGHRLDICTPNEAELQQLIDLHTTSQNRKTFTKIDLSNLRIYSSMTTGSAYKLVIAITAESLKVKHELIEDIRDSFSKETLIAINTDSISLSALGGGTNLLGLNWTDPAHTTFFLEIIAGKRNCDQADALCLLAKTHWQKDPYIVHDEGVRGRLISAIAREASFLIDNGYATVEDIDRACRNDAGYYLPFSGNCRYMDLMGTYAYAMVMKDLNPELSKDQHLPQFFNDVLVAGGQGMKNNRGFYTYSEESVAKWKDTMEKFSYEIQAIIDRYPFNYNKKPLSE